MNGFSGLVTEGLFKFETKRLADGQLTNLKHPGSLSDYFLFLLLFFFWFIELPYCLLIGAFTLIGS